MKNLSTPNGGGGDSAVVEVQEMLSLHGGHLTNASLLFDVNLCVPVHSMT